MNRRRRPDPSNRALPIAFGLSTHIESSDLWGTYSLTINSSRLFQLFKYAVYVFLAANVYLFFAEEFAAAPLRYPDGVGIANLMEAYAATIDTLAWVILLLMFELETYVVDDKHFTKPVAWTLHGLRAACYIFIILAFQGYIDVLQFNSGTTVLAGVSDVCALPPGEWSWPTTLGEYTVVTAANCADWSTATEFFRFPDAAAVVDAASLSEIVRLAWVDVINAGVWLLVVLLLEIDVRLQEHGRFEGLALRASTVSKYVLYSTLFAAAAYWGFKGDFLDFWDAFLWLVAFVFIELNVFAWHQEDAAALQAA